MLHRSGATLAATKLAAEKAGLKWRESNYLLLRRGPYVIAAGLDESIAGEPHVLHGRFVNLFDSELRVLTDVSIVPGSRWFLLDLDAARAGRPHLLASACKAIPGLKPISKSASPSKELKLPAVMLMESPKPPRSMTLAGKELATFDYSAKERLLWIHFENDVMPRQLTVSF